MKKNVVMMTIVFCLALTGCLPTMKERMIQKGFDSSYSQGYEDGVSSGKSAAGFLGHELRKDTHRFANDEQYRQGWNDGYDAGKNQERNWQRMLERGLDDDS